MSIHGICFDEGMSGHCGLECRGFIGGECDIRDEIVDNVAREPDHREGLLIYKIGKLRFEVMRAQTKIEFDEDKMIEEMIEDGSALDYFLYEY